MKALILAAGEGTRLRPLTLDRPKPMLPVGGRPMLEHLVCLLRQHAVTEVAINVHYKPQTIVEYLREGNQFGVSITYSLEQQLLGSAGAARKLDWFLDETFFVLYGDVLTDIDLSALAERHRRASAVATLALYEVEDPSRCGMVETDLDGRVTGFVEKPAPGQAHGRLANAGIYVVEPGVLDGIPRGTPYDFGADVFPDLVARGLPVHAYEQPGYILDIGSPERYAQAERDLRTGRYTPVFDREPSLVGGGS
jgi:NDP-sugar pyrophosphorylase family protein